MKRMLEKKYIRYEKDSKVFAIYYPDHKKIYYNLSANKDAKIIIMQRKVEMENVKTN